MGGGGLYATVGDYLTFARMILHGGTFNGVAGVAAGDGGDDVAERDGRACVQCDEDGRAGRPRNDVDFLAGMKWGLSFLINPEPLPTGRSAGSLAWAGLANSYYWIDPATQVAGVYATQVLPFFDPKAVQAFEAFETAVYGALPG